MCLFIRYILMKIIATPEQNCLRNQLLLSINANVMLCELPVYTTIAYLQTTL